LAHDTELECERDGLGAASRSELDEGTTDVPIHRSLADTERSGDLLRCLAARYVSQDLDFSPR
jgi:hypothetical protein